MGVGWENLEVNILILLKGYNFVKNIQTTMAIATGIINLESSHVRKYRSSPILAVSSWFFINIGGKIKPKATPSCVPKIPKAHAVETSKTNCSVQKRLQSLNAKHLLD